MNTGSGNFSVVTEELEAKDSTTLSRVEVNEDNRPCEGPVSDEPTTPVEPQQHNDLLGLQGGTQQERYHVDANIYGALIAATDASPENRFATVNDLSNDEYVEPSSENPFITLRAIPDEEVDPTVPQWVKDITEEDIERWDSNAESGDYTAGSGISIINNVISLETESKTLVTPVITAAWTFTKADGTGYTPSTASTPSVTVDVGVRASVSARYQYPAPNSTQGLPTSVSGNFGITLPGPNTPSIPLNVALLTSNAAYSVTLYKPKSGLSVVGSQVVVATGNDTTTATVSIAFSNKLYYGTTLKSGSILDSDILSLSSEFRANRLKTFTNFAGGAARILIGVPTAFGTASFKVNGLANTAFTKVRSNTDFVNAGGGTIPLDVYLSNNVYNSPLDSFEIL